MQSLSDARAKATVDEIGGEGAWAHWAEDGNLLVQNMFRWLWDGITVDEVHEAGVGGLIAEEFDLYIYHQRERNGAPNKGWLRTMFFSLTQQVNRQDLEYWALYAMSPSGSKSPPGILSLLREIRTFR